eukprot:scaffold34371_cov129-Isochrysis_galbana.AAC.2
MSAGRTRRWATPVRTGTASRGACILAPDTVSCCDDGARRRRMAGPTSRPDVQVVLDDLLWSCVGRTYDVPASQGRLSGKIVMRGTAAPRPQGEIPSRSATTKLRHVFSGINNTSGGG